MSRETEEIGLDARLHRIGLAIIEGIAEFFRRATGAED